jgi:hypothetical protein
MAISDNPTTRESLRRAVLGDLVDRCTAAAVSIEGGALDGIEVVSLGTLRAQVTNALEDDLPPPSERRAEVTTPAIVLVSAICPECRLPVEIIVALTPQLTADNDGAEIAVKAKSKSRVHVCGQLALALVGDQADFGLEDITGAVPDVATLYDALTLVITDRADLTVEAIAEWSDLDKRLSYEWANRTLEAASDSDVVVPPLPKILWGDDPDAEANPEGAALPPDAPADDGSAASTPSDPCPFPDCIHAAEHSGEHEFAATVAEIAERIETIYSQAADRVAAKRAGRLKAQGPGFTPGQASAAAEELERDLDGPAL